MIKHSIIAGMDLNSGKTRTGVGTKPNARRARSGSAWTHAEPAERQQCEPSPTGVAANLLCSSYRFITELDLSPQLFAVYIVVS